MPISIMGGSVQRVDISRPILSFSIPRLWPCSLESARIPRSQKQRPRRHAKTTRARAPRSACTTHGCLMGASPGGAPAAHLRVCDCDLSSPAVSAHVVEFSFEAAAGRAERLNESRQGIRRPAKTEIEGGDFEEIRKTKTLI